MIDPSIALGVKPVQIENPINSLVQMMQAKHLQNQISQQEFANDEIQRGVDNNNKLRELLSSNQDQNSPEFIRRVSGIDPSFAEKIAKSKQDKLKSDSDCKIN